MSDLISRQAAIRWVKTECNPYGKPTLELVEIIPEVRRHTDSGRRIMDSRSIGKMLERDFQ